MKSAIDKVFFDHPHSVNESYGEHFRFAMGFSLKLIGAGLAAMVHALIPCLFKTTASSAIKQMHARIVNRGVQPTETTRTSPQQA
jgi:hypothetical protein